MLIPGAKRRAEREAQTNTFAAVAIEWRLTGSIEVPELPEVLQRIEAKGVIEPPVANGGQRGGSPSVHRLPVSLLVLGPVYWERADVAVR